MKPAAGTSWRGERHGARARRWSVCAAFVLVALGIAGCDDDSVDKGGGGKPIKTTVVLGGLGDTPGRFGYPRCLNATDTSLWVIDKTARVQEIDPKTGACLTVWRMPEWDLGKPTGFTIAPGHDQDGKWINDLLYIADTHYHRVMIYEPPKHDPNAAAGTRPAEGPRLVGSFGSYGDGPGQFYYPTDVAVLLTADGKSIERIFVSEYGGNDRISVFDGSYKWLYAFGKEGGGKDPSAIEFNRPQSIAIWSRSDGSKELIVTDACNHRLGRFTLDGKLLAWIGSPQTTGKGLGQFGYPYGLHILSDGTALVSEFGGCRVQRVDLATGRGIEAWGTAGRGEGELAAPWAVTTMGKNVYVLDSANNRILGFVR